MFPVKVMRRVSFVLSMIGLFLLVLFIYEGPREGNFESKDVNEEVVVSGILSSIRSSTYATFFRIGDYEAYCDCDVFAYSGRNVEAKGVVAEYSGKKMIRILSIRG